MWFYHVSTNVHPTLAAHPTQEAQEGEVKDEMDVEKEQTGPEGQGRGLGGLGDFGV